VTEFGDAIQVGQFYGTIYNTTPAHMDEIHAAMIENADLEITTEGEECVAGQTRLKWMTHFE